jgi:FAD/FMN-containing dehydrogenase
MTLSRMSHPLSTTHVQTNSKLYKYDLSVCLQDVPVFITEMKEVLMNKGCRIVQTTRELEEWKHIVYNNASDAISDNIALEVFTFGHAGDQNIHLNIIAHYLTSTNIPSSANQRDQMIQTIQSVLDDVIYPLILARNGSLSAEHGIGQQKKKALLLSRSKEEIMVMKQLKQVFDPNNILNPGKMFD